MRNKGFSMVELLCAIVITTIILIGLLRCFPLGMMQTKVSSHRVSAVNLAQEKLEELLSDNYASIDPATYPQVENNIVIDGGSDPGIADDLPGVRTTEVELVTEGKKITVTVQWNDFYGTTTEVLETLYSPVD